tara:strand:+ start:6277 stop:6657 length:381 start_codon:yes stop_codon:yes gene_type:complete
MATDGIRVSGLNKAIRGLKVIGVPANEIALAGNQAGQLIADAARTLVPVKTGALRSTIRVAKQQRKIVIRAGSSKVPYANPIHWGWFRRNIAPNEFFARALNLNIDAVYKRYFDNIDKLITKYGGK